MSFSSLIFLLLFLPVCLLIYYRLPSLTAKNYMLLIASLVFCLFGGLGSLAAVVLLTLFVWITARIIDGQSYDYIKKRWLIITVAVLLAVLGVFKYTGFIVRSIGSLLPFDTPVIRIALPLGISFYTFKLISYVVDVYRGRCRAEMSFALLLLYSLCFHTLTQGPIVRYTDVRQEFHRRSRSPEVLSAGICRFCIGLAKKSILADHCGELAASLLPVSGDITSIPVTGVWIGSLCYMMQIYLDFSAYSDMALGLGLMMGFHYKENFDYPYISVSVGEFWRRWHISLGSFFRDYVYIPLGGNRCTFGRQVLNLLVVWALTGLWHGASWNYVLWGLYYFVFLVIENARKRKGRHPVPAVLGHIITLVVVYFGWIIFRFEDFSLLGKAILGLFGLNGNAATGAAVTLTIRNNIFFLIFSAAACTPLFRFIRRKAEERFSFEKGTETPIQIYNIISSAALLVLSILALVGGSFTPFLYNQF